MRRRATKVLLAVTLAVSMLLTGVPVQSVRAEENVAVELPVVTVVEDDDLAGEEATEAGTETGDTEEGTTEEGTEAGETGEETPEEEIPEPIVMDLSDAGFAYSEGVNEAGNVVYHVTVTSASLTAIADAEE